jgi:hypothetical protein
LLSRVTLIGGVALLATFANHHFPREQTLVIRLGSRDVARIEGFVTAPGDDEPTAGFSRVFPEKSPSVVRYAFKAATGTYIVVINLKERGGGLERTERREVEVETENPNLTETTFERRVSLAGGEVIVSPD